MSSKFKPSLLTRAVNALRSADIAVDRIRIEVDPISGKFAITTGEAVGTEHATDLDTWMAKNARKT